MDVVLLTGGLQFPERYALGVSAELLPIWGVSPAEQQANELVSAGAERIHLVVGTCAESWWSVRTPEGSGFITHYSGGHDPVGQMREVLALVQRPILVTSAGQGLMAEEARSFRENAIRSGASVVFLRGYSGVRAVWLRPDVLPQLRGSHDWGLAQMVSVLTDQVTILGLAPPGPRTLLAHHARWSNQMRDGSGQGTGLVERRSGVWVHGTAQVTQAVIDAAVGPVWIGPRARVGSGVQLVGPVEIGADALVGRGASLSNTAILPGACVVGQERRNGSLVGVTRWWQREDDSVREVDGARTEPMHARAADRRGDRLERRLEVAATAAVLALVSPLLVLAGAATIWMDGGPVMHQGVRCVRPGDDETGVQPKTIPFPVLRTMVSGADARRQELDRMNAYDKGPFRKSERDPRVTPFGWWLRKTSIDELPLLWQVLQGRLGLVGVWALPMDEAQDLAMGRGLGALGSVARKRFGARPGLAGLWQAFGRKRHSAVERVVYDTYQAVVMDRRNTRLLRGPYRSYQSLVGRLRLVAQTVLGALKLTGV